MMILLYLHTTTNPQQEELMSEEVDYRSLYEEINRSVRVSGDDYAIGDDSYEHSICGCRLRCEYNTRIILRVRIILR